MRLLRIIPLMGVVLLLYNIFALSYSDPNTSFWQQEMLPIHLPSGRTLMLTYGMVFISFAMLVLFIELVKSTTASNAAMIEQTLSTLSSIGFLILFLAFPHAAEPTFFMLLIISLVEMLTGFVIPVKVARIDVEVDK